MSLLDNTGVAPGVVWSLYLPWNGVVFLYCPYPAVDFGTVDLQYSDWFTGTCVENRVENMFDVDFHGSQQHQVNLY